VHTPRSVVEQIAGSGRQEQRKYAPSSLAQSRDTHRGSKYKFSRKHHATKQPCDVDRLGRDKGGKPRRPPVLGRCRSNSVVGWLLLVTVSVEASPSGTEEKLIQCSRYLAANSRVFPIKSWYTLKSCRVTAVNRRHKPSSSFRLIEADWLCLSNALNCRFASVAGTIGPGRVGDSRPAKSQWTVTQMRTW